MVLQCLQRYYIDVTSYTRKFTCHRVLNHWLSLFGNKEALVFIGKKVFSHNVRLKTTNNQTILLPYHNSCYRNTRFTQVLERRRHITDKGMNLPFSRKARLLNSACLRADKTKPSRKYASLAGSEYLSGN